MNDELRAWAEGTRRYVSGDGLLLNGVDLLDPAAVRGVVDRFAHEVAHVVKPVGDRGGAPFIYLWENPYGYVKWEAQATTPRTKDLIFGALRGRDGWLAWRLFRRDHTYFEDPVRASARVIPVGAIVAYGTTPEEARAALVGELLDSF